MSQLKVLAQEMADLTLPECRKCRVPFNCCSLSACELTEGLAQAMEIDLPPRLNDNIPYLGDNGCILEPWQRIICATHTCDIAAVGCKPKDLEWTTRYWILREKIMIELEGYFA